MHLLEKIIGQTDLTPELERELESEKLAKKERRFSDLEHLATSLGWNRDKYIILERIAHLRDKGVLTEEEFQAEKKKLLDEGTMLNG